MRSSESIGLLNICFYSALLRCAITRTGERLLPYSKPTTGSSWLDPFKHERQIHLETILTYMDEIHGVSAYRRIGVSASEVSRAMMCFSGDNCSEILEFSTSSQYMFIRTYA
jgi:hypothetical protein